MARPIARFRPAFREIRLYSDRLEYRGKSYSLEGVEAEVTQTGNKRLLGDNRQTYLTITGVEVALSLRLIGNEELINVGPARRFAAKVNQTVKARS